MLELKLFENAGLGNIRVLLENENLLFVASDVAKLIGYENTRDAINVHCRYVVKRYIPHPQSASKEIEVSVIPESDVYRLIIKSNLPKAQDFEKWVMEEVLPSIRKSGNYSIEKPKTTLELLELAVSELRAKEEQLKQLEHKNEIQGSTINRLVHSKQTYTTTLLAKELGFRSAIELNKILEAQNIQFKHNGVWVLYAKYSGCGYTETKQTILDNGKIVYDRVWTGLGRDFIVRTIVR